MRVSMGWLGFSMQIRCSSNSSGGASRGSITWVSSLRVGYSVLRLELR
jgi:hypothetical protein